ncbi:hypothetical protein EJ08DRAFT_663586 [Tothia fuscella]|uniref:Uncharacterized protein n=1 Tax=Tothia fuscella TaxID=1048955 RepID=A0A9P4NL83_9PEZI|nr:hypothetical protein EJ08DRAFT_663586 [Tothia fuscella]
MSQELKSKHDTYAATQDVEEVRSMNGAQRVAVAAGQSPNQPILERYINLASVINFDVILLCSWEAFALTFQFALLNGGPASMASICWSSIQVVGQFCTICTQVLGLIQGWITIFAWMIAAAGPPAIVANIITALAVFSYDTYVPKSWHTMLIMWALIMVPFVFNLWFRKLINALETVGGLCHVCFYIISMVTLVVMAGRSTDEFVWKTLTHGQSGWENQGVTWSLGLLMITFSINGFDGVLHMSGFTRGRRTIQLFANTRERR